MARTDRDKWNRAAPTYDTIVSQAAERRWTAYKRDLFGGMEGLVLFLSAGTGVDFQFFPSARRIVSLDVSERMLERAAERAQRYDGVIELHQMDVGRLGFADDSFDQIYTSCTFCSVSDPLRGLRELYRVLRPGGSLRMFEHTGSRWFPFNLMLTVCTPLSRRFGPEMNRPTVDTVREAGFVVQGVTHHYLDVLKSIEARKPLPSSGTIRLSGSRRR